MALQIDTSINLGTGRLRMIRIADFIAKKLENYGVKHVFMISGGGAMHLNDAIGKSKIRYICNHHEQASAIAAEGYARINNDLSVVIVTSGPGGTNTITGLIGQWLDSVPVLFLSGQVKFETTIKSCPEIDLRQLGDQEINIVDIVRPVTKYASMVTDPLDIRYEMEKAIHIAKTGRFGPVWLDIPLNVQGAVVDEMELRPFPPEIRECPGIKSKAQLDTDVKDVIDMIEESKRPVFIAGHGIRLAGAIQNFKEFINNTNIPVVTTFCGYDLLPTEHPNFVGRIGTIGDRAGNFAIQNSDLVLAVGTRNNIRQISYSWDFFARNAKKIVVDIDAAELKKPTLSPDLAIHCDAIDFLQLINNELNSHKKPNYKEWVDWCIERKHKYPTVLTEYQKVTDGIQPYVFINTLTELLDDEYIIVAGNGSACVVLFQAGIVKENQRIFWNSGCASMGYDLPAAIGAHFASGKKVICLAGDGSIMMNLQELQTIKYYNLPIKIFVLNNSGYCSIKQTQDSFFEGRRVACDSSCGVGFPAFSELASAFGLSSASLKKHDELHEGIENIIASNDPFLCEVCLTNNYSFSPKLSSQKKDDGRIISKPLEDMYPFLDRKEFIENLLIPPVEED